MIPRTTHLRLILTSLLRITRGYVIIFCVSPTYFSFYEHTKRHLFVNANFPCCPVYYLSVDFSRVIFLRHPSSKDFVVSNERQIKQLQFFILGIAEKLMFLSSDMDFYLLWSLILQQFDFNDKIHRFTDK